MNCVASFEDVFRLAVELYCDILVRVCVKVDKSGKIILLKCIQG